MGKVGGGGAPLAPAVATIVALVLGNPQATPPDGGTSIDGLADVVKVGLIPPCAMRVTRATDGGNLAPYTAAAPCGCYYASKTPGATGAPAGCVACAQTADCGDAGATCSHGFCEPALASTSSPGDAGSCFSATPSTHAQIINACTNSQAIAKNVVLPAADGGLEPLP